ncbi:MAG: UDP-N-acetylmuramoyl-L-alanine--D-glutamate ligase [Phycisphaerales bacterium]|nr:MAG: UDP-N-acetylmuramoyl-L-alanine--D-glutamate ligase [Phycisphaerales bacterium]
MNASDLKDRTVLVMGLGRFGGGVDVARFAAGAGARVVVTDAATEEKLVDSLEQLRELPGIELKLGGHDPDDFMAADMVVVNPAVRGDHPLLEIARQHQKTITSQIGLFFQMCPARIVGITGANGKSTTATLTAHVLRRAPAMVSKSRHPRAALEAASGRVWLSGNIGNRPLLGTLAEVAPSDLVVLELSSFQLEQLAEIEMAPQISLLTNLTPNHLDRHGTFEAYCAAKENIFRLQRRDAQSPAVSIFNAEDLIASEWFEKYRVQSGRLCMKYSADDVPANVRAAFPLPGRANLSNLAGALAVARYFGIQNEAIIRVLPDVKALPHRLELVATIDGVRWYNDSIATTPQSAVVALEAFAEPKILIAGGYDKQLPFDELGEKIAAQAKAVVLIGQAASKIADAIQAGGPSGPQVPIAFAKSLDEAVQIARRQAVEGDVVLLSPACASYDMFDNFQQRGQQFAELVGQLGRQL